MVGWRAAFCVADNLVPHRTTSAPEHEDPPSSEGVRGLRWVCRLHDWAGNVECRG